MSEKGISVIIPNYNGQHLLDQNLPSLYDALTTSGIDDYEIIVADDASSDNSVEYLKKSYPEIIIIENISNQGFSSNVNSGLCAATKELVFILNTDIKLYPKYFKPLLPYFDWEDTFGVMGRIIDPSNEKFNIGAKGINYKFGNFKLIERPLKEKEERQYTLFLSGANALIDRLKLNRMSGFDTSFDPFYYEDSELGLRAWRLGYKLYYNAHAICEHQTSTTISKQPAERIKLIAKKNKMALHYIHLNGYELRYYMFVLSLKVLGRLIFLNTSYYRSYMMLLKSRKLLNQSKKKISTLQDNSNIGFTVKDIASLLK